MTAFQRSKLSAQGAPETPAGGSDCKRLKSRTCATCLHRVHQQHSLLSAPVFASKVSTVRGVA